MKAVVFQNIGEIAMEEVPDPKIQSPTDAIVRITTSAICGTDLHMVRGTMPGMKPGTVLGHEAVGVVEEVGKDVRNLRKGDRVVIPSTIACGSCWYCRAGYQSQCDVANPHGPSAGTAFFGGPEETGPFDGLQAQYARVPFANVGPVKLPESMSDQDAILLSDIFPTAWFGAKLAEVSPGDTVAVFGAGVVGQLAMTSAFMQGAGRVIAIDNKPDRLEHAQFQGAEAVNFDDDDAVETIKHLTRGIGVDRVIDAVGVDAEKPHGTSDENWQPGNGPSQALQWAVESLAKAGTLGIIGVYPQTMKEFPIGAAMNKNLTIKMGNCHHRHYIPELIDIVQSGRLSLHENVTRHDPLTDAIEAYETFDRRESGWIKVALDPRS
jgi:threonine dehydrogenase-like Zn-dependent dehydrogenase